jgi:RNA polymerase primary sigma factor
MMRALADQSRTIRIPGHIVQVLHRLSRASRKLLQQLGREPSPQELAAEVNLPEELVLAVLRASKEPLSLEMPFGQEDDSELRDNIVDPKSPEPESEASRGLLREQVHLVLAALTKKEREILTMRFGLHDGRYHTLEEVGRALGIPRERVRQTEGKALRKLRHPALCTKLRDFIEL